MAVSLHHVVIDAHDLPALARFWAQVLGWRILSEREREVVIGPDATAPVTGLTLAAAALRDDHQHVRCRAAAARAGSSSPWRWAA